MINVAQTVAEETCLCLHDTFLGNERLYAFITHLNLYYKRNHVVFAGQQATEYSARGWVQKGMPFHHLSVVDSRLEVNADQTVTLCASLVTVESLVVAVEWREQMVADEGGAVDVGGEITHYIGHYSAVAADGAACRMDGCLVGLVLMKGYCGIGLAQMAALLGTGKRIEMGYTYKGDVATVSLDVSLQICCGGVAFYCAINAGTVTEKTVEY